MYNSLRNPEMVIADRFLIHRTVAIGSGMSAMEGFDQQNEEPIFVKTRDPVLDNRASIRITHEAEVLASLDHPQIPRLVADDAEADVPYIVTELGAEDSKVTEGFVANPHPVFAAQLCVEALEPLAYAHERGITHNDVKPSNLLMTWDGEVALTDWETALSDRIELTDLRVDKDKTFGSIGYVSPEGMPGNSVEPDRRSDIYSMGVVLHVFLHGKLPVAGQTNEQTINNILDETFSFAPGREVPNAISEIAAIALQEHPENRYQSAGEMSEELQKFLIDTVGRESANELIQA